MGGDFVSAGGGWSTKCHGHFRLFLAVAFYLDGRGQKWWIHIHVFVSNASIRYL